MRWRLTRFDEVVDVGANVRYTLVFFARRFPAARFLAFEPHPGNAQQAVANIVGNRLQDRVTLLAEAAETARGTIWWMGGRRSVNTKVAVSPRPHLRLNPRAHSLSRNA